MLGALRAQALSPTLRLWAVGAPPEARERFRARGYRWMPAPRNDLPRAWWTDLDPEMLECERAWLADAVYGTVRGVSYTGPPGPNTLAVRRIDARTRWRADPTDCEQTTRRAHRGIDHAIA